MAIRPVGKDERLKGIFDGVPLIYSRITSAERQKVMTDLERYGTVPDRAVMDNLIPKHLHGYEPDPDDSETWIERDDGTMLPASDFRPDMAKTWPEETKAKIWAKMHENSRGEDIRELEKEGKDRSGNLNSGSAQPMNLVD